MDSEKEKRLLFIFLHIKFISNLYFSLSGVSFQILFSTRCTCIYRSLSLSTPPTREPFLAFILIKIQVLCSFKLDSVHEFCHPDSDLSGWDSRRGRNEVYSGRTWRRNEVRQRMHLEGLRQQMSWIYKCTCNQQNNTNACTDTHAHTICVYTCACVCGCVCVCVCVCVYVHIYVYIYVYIYIYI